MAPLLKLFARLKWTEEHAGIVQRLLDELARFCHFPKLVHVPHTTNQELLLRHDVINIIFEIVHQGGDGQLLVRSVLCALLVDTSTCMYRS